MTTKVSGLLHCYQPPRDMWDVGFLPREKRFSAIAFPKSRIPFPDGQPADDWNRSITEECYRKLAESCVLSRIPFNAGPTLIRDLAIHDRPVYDRILRSEELSTQRFGGHSNALAQASPSHSILPLFGDSVTHDDVLVDEIKLHLLWSIEEYQKHFNKFPEGMWLPEAAVDMETLKILAEVGIKYTVLAPKQAKRIRPIGGDDNSWQGVEGGRINPSMPYKASFEDAKEIAIFFYDGPISADIAHREVDDWVYQSSENFIERWLSGTQDGDLRTWGVDGETFGHHKKGKADLLAGAVNLIDSGKYTNIELMNYGQYLELNPPKFEVEVFRSAWSCEHELARWGQESIHCECGAGHPNWRVPFRRALDELAVELDGIYYDVGRKVFKNPEEALIKYASVISGRTKFEDFYEDTKLSSPRIKNPTDKAYKLLEIMRFKIYMYTSCGWFWDSVGRIEPFTNFLAANSAIKLAKEISPRGDIEDNFVHHLPDHMKHQYSNAVRINDDFIRQHAS